MGGFFTDIAVSEDRTSSPSLYVEIDGPQTTLRRLDTSPPSVPIVRGHVMMKRLVFQRHGFRVVVLSEELWSSFCSDKEKACFIRELMRMAGMRNRFLL